MKLTAVMAHLNNEIVL